MNDPDVYDHLITMMEFINTYTEIRKFAWDAVKVNQSGETFSLTSSDQAEKLKACQGL